MAKTIDPLERIYRLLSERSRIEKEFREAEQQFRKVADEAVTELKSTILSLCEAAGTTVSDLFGYVSDAVGATEPAPAAPARKKAGRPKKTAAAAPAAAPVAKKKPGRPAKSAVAAAAPAAAPVAKKKAGRPKKVVVDAAPAAASAPATAPVTKKAVRPAKAAKAVKPAKPAKPAKAAKATRTKGVGKYLLGGKAFDGREARAVAAFDFVRTDGLIDDVKALAARVVNPEWLTTPSVASKKFVAEYKIDVAAYAGGN